MSTIVIAEEMGGRLQDMGILAPAKQPLRQEPKGRQALKDHPDSKGHLDPKVLLQKTRVISLVCRAR
jgi:hypothetical protein